MERTQLQAAPREERGSNACARLRRLGFVPAVVYGHALDPVALTVDARELRDVLAHHHGSHAILELVIRGNGDVQTETALIQDLERNPVTHEVLSVDFLRVSLEEKITTTVPVTLLGQSRGVKEGGILEHEIHEVEVECLPADLPEELTVEMTPFGIGESVHVRDIQCPPGVTILTPGDDAIAHVNAPKLHVEVAEAVAEPAEAEPKLVKQKGSKAEEE